MRPGVRRRRHESWRYARQPRQAVDYSILWSRRRPTGENMVAECRVITDNVHALHSTRVAIFIFRYATAVRMRMFLAPAPLHHCTSDGKTWREGNMREYLLCGHFLVFCQFLRITPNETVSMYSRIFFFRLEHFSFNSLTFFNIYSDKFDRSNYSLHLVFGLLYECPFSDLITKYSIKHLSTKIVFKMCIRIRQ